MNVAQINLRKKSLLVKVIEQKPLVTKVIVSESFKKRMEKSSTKVIEVISKGELPKNELNIQVGDYLIADYEALEPFDINVDDLVGQELYTINSYYIKAKVNLDQE